MDDKLCCEIKLNPPVRLRIQITCIMEGTDLELIIRRV
jgi:hypothetical protein